MIFLAIDEKPVDIVSLLFVTRKIFQSREKSKNIIATLSKIHNKTGMYEKKFSKVKTRVERKFLVSIILYLKVRKVISFFIEINEM